MLSDVLSIVKQVAGYNHPINDQLWADAIIAIEEEVIANLECPAAKHHRMTKYLARKIIGFDEFGYTYGDEELVSDKCTACGFDYYKGD